MNDSVFNPLNDLIILTLSETLSKSVTLNNISDNLKAMENTSDVE